MTLNERNNFIYTNRLIDEAKDPGAWTQPRYMFNEKGKIVPINLVDRKEKV